jgi:prepilin-type N-terminal cleavage/methylation domain-containing protein
MKTIARRHFPGKAFTLIELLVVVSIIAILAGLLFAAIPQISGKRTRAIAFSELFQVQAAIEAYKTAYGSYPPDNPNNVAVNPLFYELQGTTNGGGVYVTLDQKYQIGTNAIKTAFTVNGFINSSTSAKSTDDRPAPVSFLKELRPGQIGAVGVTNLLVCSEGWTKPGSASGLAVWRYNSSHPTNNAGSYDLWVDLYVNGKTNRISNWSKEPINVY